MNPTRRFLMPLCLALAALPVLADDDCDVPLPQWRTRDAVMRTVAQRGWKVQRLKIDDGCYEVRGRDAQGREFKAKLDPRTLETVKFKRRDGARDRDRERIDRPAAPAPGTDAGTPGAPGAVIKPGTTPRAQIE